MTQTLALNLLHCVCSTRHRENLIRDPEKLWNDLQAIARDIGVNILRIGGTTNHVHMLLAVPPTHTVADVIRDLKAKSSRHLNEEAPFACQDGYAVFSVSPSLVEKAAAYISNQQDHHARVWFEEQYRALADPSGLPYPQKSLLG